MLQLKSKGILEINKISKILAKYELSARITNQTVTIKSGDITEELIQKMCENMHISSFQNFSVSEQYNKKTGGLR